MSADPIRDEQRAQNRYTLLLALLLTAALGITAVLTWEQYVHPMPASDCSRPLDYPMCERAAVPPGFSEPSDSAYFIGTIITAILAIVLIWVGYHASVVRQAELVTSAAGTITSSNPAGSIISKAPPAAPPATPQKETVTLSGTDPKTKTPPTIINNTITPDMIAPPKAQPKALSKGEIATVGGTT